MSIQAIILETGEHIITDVQEVIDKAENKSLGYKFLNPFIIDLQYTVPVDVPLSGEGAPADASDAKINLIPWCPLSDAREFQVEHVFCRVIYKAHGDLEEIYVNTVAQWNEHNLNEVTVDTGRTIVTTDVSDSPFADGAKAEDSMMSSSSGLADEDQPDMGKMFSGSAGPEPEDGYGSGNTSNQHPGQPMGSNDPSQTNDEPADGHGSNVLPTGNN